MSKIVTSEAHVVMDYPQESEKIVSPQYTFRIATSDEVQGVELSIDGGAFQPCRRTNGFFWYDWSNYGSGEHDVVARARLHDGTLESTDLRRIFVDLGGRQGFHGRFGRN